MAQQTTSTALPKLPTLTSSLPEPDWLSRLRSSAWSHYQALPAQNTGNTDLESRSWDFGPFPEAKTDTEAELARTLAEQAKGNAVVYVQDGMVQYVHLPEDLAKQGVIFTDLQTAAAKYGALVEKHLCSVVKQDESKWAALNTALWHGGAFLYVPRHVQVEQSFLFIYSESDGGRGAMPRVLVVGEEDSRFSYTEAHFSAASRGQSYVHSEVLEVVAASNASITVASFNQLVKGPTHFLVKRASLAEDANVDWIFGDIGDGFTLAAVESCLNGTGSHSTNRTMSVGYGRQRLNLTSSMVHSGRFSESDMQLQAVLRGRANALYRSSTHILKGALSAGSEQTERAVVLDSTAKANAIPMLLIDENEVNRCGHAASVGKIDPEQIYYLMSRGISKAQATQIIIWGRLGPIVEALPVEGLRTCVTELLSKELIS